MPLKNPLENEPVAIAGAVRAVLHTLVLLGVIALDAPALSSISLAIELVLTLVVRQSVFSASTHEREVEEAGQGLGAETTS